MGYASVSYTHLDVYKRQVYVDGKKVSLPEDNIEFINITASHHVKVVFVKEGSGGMPDNNNQYRIDTGIIGGKGTILSLIHIY